MKQFSNLESCMNTLADGRGYEVRVKATDTGIEFRTLSGSLIWHYEKIASIDNIDFAIEVERELVRIGVEAKEVAMNCVNGNCGRYQTKHIEGCEFAAKKSEAITSVIFPDPDAWLSENIGDLEPDSVCAIQPIDFPLDMKTVGRVRDVEDGTVKELGPNDYVRALRTMCELVDSKKIFLDGVTWAHDLTDAGNWDAEVTDTFFQLAYHNEVIYG